jgi:hypothetical protein
VIWGGEERGGAGGSSSLVRRRQPEPCAAAVQGGLANGGRRPLSLGGLTWAAWASWPLGQLPGRAGPASAEQPRNKEILFFEFL